jgi:pantoate--beta-alanine ligase
VIGCSAAENDETIVTIYPNKAQLAPGAVYPYDFEKDVSLAGRSGATIILTPGDNEMYPPEYRTYLDQGEVYGRMDGTVLPFLFRSMITMSFRWVNALRPDRAYWGMKDIGQTLLVTRALRDFLVPTHVRRVPCVRTDAGVPTSSRLMDMNADQLEDIASIYRALTAGLGQARTPRNTRVDITGAMQAVLQLRPLRHFQLRYLDCFDPNGFGYATEAIPPFILHGAVSGCGINHFDGLLIETQKDLLDGPAMHWVSSPSRASEIAMEQSR